MKTRLITILIALFAVAANLSAQTAKSVLDKTAALYNSGAVQIAFTTSGAQGSTSGTLIAQGNKFTLQSNQATIWFDGKTQWSIYQGSDEVNLTEPTAKEIASINPMNFVTCYKSGYKSSLKTVGSNYEAHLTATSSFKSIKEMYVTIDKATSKPVSVKFRTGVSNWTTINISSCQTMAAKSESFFRFNAKDNPKLHLIDLR